MLPVFDEGNVLISGELSASDASGSGEGGSEGGDGKEGGAEKDSEDNIPEMQFRPLYRARPSEISEASFLQVRIIRHYIYNCSAFPRECIFATTFSSLPSVS
tara:strand:+ start:1355 stop:1660 length:306 start_codon:yes stop_codon:yes gene_type:complete